MAKQNQGKKEKFWCELGIHTWSAWHEVEYQFYPREGLFGPIDESVIGIKRCQRRECISCGKIKEEII